MAIRSNHCLPEKINLAEYVPLAKETLSFVESFPAVTATPAIHMPEFVQCLKEVLVSNVFITTAALRVETVICTCPRKTDQFKSVRQVGSFANTPKVCTMLSSGQ